VFVRSPSDNGPSDTPTSGFSFFSGHFTVGPRNFRSPARLRVSAPIRNVSHVIETRFPAVVLLRNIPKRARHRIRSSLGRPRKSVERTRSSEIITITFMDVGGSGIVAYGLPLVRLRLGRGVVNRIFVTDTVLLVGRRSERVRFSFQRGGELRVSISLRRIWDAMTYPSHGDGDVL